MNNKYESLELGQFIPLHYHYNMLNDHIRIKGFKDAIDLVVKPGDKVLELGGGTGVQSFFAAQKAEKVWCVERNPELVAAARSIIAKNKNGDRVEIIQADASQYLPPEPVDVVICEMLHTGLLREKQLPIIDAFKKNYLEKFGGPLPIFVPEVSIQAIQPVTQNFDFEGYCAPTVIFQDPYGAQDRTIDLSTPEVFQMVSYQEDFSQTCSWNGIFTITESGSMNALRMITKNLLAIDISNSSTIDWLTQHIVFPLEQPIDVMEGDLISVRFSYQGGDSLNLFSDSLDLRSLSIIDDRRIVTG